MSETFAARHGAPVVTCAVFKYFPFGGMQRDFVRIARALHQQGAHVRVYVGQLEGELPEFLEVVKVPLSGFSNHQQLRSFAKFIEQHEHGSSGNIRIGFNKLPNLDWYYAADGCLQERWQHSLQRWFTWLPRYRTYAEFERAVFAPDARCRVLLISDVQGEHYRAYYHTPMDRFVSLPPGINRERFQLTDVASIRQCKRNELGIATQATVLLSVGSGFRIKGVDRSLNAVARLPVALRQQCHLLIVGQDNAKPFMQQAKALGLHQVRFLGGRHDVPELMAASDLLLHPAYSENTGTVLLEAVTAGLPVICSARCGYAPLVAQAGGGVVLPEPFSLTRFVETIAGLLQSRSKLALLADQGRRFAAQADWFAMPERVAERVLATADNGG